MVEIVDIDKWPVVERWTTTGSRNKIWISDIPPDVTGFFLFKESHQRYPWEFWTEIIAYQFGLLVGVPVPLTRCASLKDIYGALIDYIPKVVLRKETSGQIMASTVEQMFDGGEWVLKLDPTFDRKEGTKHNICQIEKILNKSEFRQFCRMLVFDALIGNTDRHQDNWALLVAVQADAKKAVERSLAPAYDNASSLGTNLMDEALSRYVKSETDLEKFILKGMQHLRWSEDGKTLVQLNHFDFLGRLSQKHAFVRDDVKQLSSFDARKFRTIVTSLTETPLADNKYRFAPLRADFVCRYVLKRREMLRSAFGFK